MLGTDGNEMQARNQVCVCVCVLIEQRGPATTSCARVIASTANQEPRELLMLSVSYRASSLKTDLRLVCIPRTRS